jgi:hypothetical protein
VALTGRIPAVEVRKVIGLTVDDYHEAGLCLGDPTAYV